jgi:hypothetical protein
VVANVALNVFTNYFNNLARTTIDFPPADAPGSAERRRVQHRAPAATETLALHEARATRRGPVQPAPEMKESRHAQPRKTSTRRSPSKAPPAKVRAAEDAWNSRDPERVALAYTEDSEWRNREYVSRWAAPRYGPSSRSKWRRELDYRLAKSLWACTDNRIAVRFQYEWRDR